MDSRRDIPAVGAGKNFRSAVESYRLLFADSEGLVKKILIAPVMPH
jgi:hypothetical protein